jgi:TPR repeat protein
MSLASVTSLPTTLEQFNRIPAAEWTAILAGDPVHARQWVETAARLGSSEAQVVLGEWLLEGRGGPRDAEQAVRWFLKAASQQNPLAINMVGRCHENGWGVAEDQTRATGLYRQAADLGLATAMYNYANQLASGKGITQDHKKALGWHSAAAEQGYAKAKTKVGRYFEEGLVVEKDLAMAFNCYREAAEGGDFRGQFCYAGMLAAHGKHVEALHWLRKVPQTATPAYLAEAGRVLQESADQEFRTVGSEMTALAASRAPLI